MWRQFRSRIANGLRGGICVQRVVDEDGGAGERAASLRLEAEAEVAGCSRRQREAECAVLRRAEPWTWTKFVRSTTSPLAMASSGWLPMF